KATSCQPFPAAEPPFAEEAAECEEKYERCVPDRTRPGFRDRRMFRWQVAGERSEVVRGKHTPAGLLGEPFHECAIRLEIAKFRGGEIARPAGRALSSGGSAFVCHFRVDAIATAFAWDEGRFVEPRFAGRWLRVERERCVARGRIWAGHFDGD